MSSLPFLSRLPRPVALLAPLLLAAAVLVPTGEARAQTTVTLVSNTGQVVGENSAILFPLAQGFRTGGKIAGYNLASVGIALGALGTDLNVANTATVTLRKSTSGAPGDVVYTFTSPTLAADSVNTFTAPDGAVLSAVTDYFLVVQVTAGAVFIQATLATAEDSGAAAGFSIANNRRSCGSPCTFWFSNSEILRVDVKGSVVANAAPTAADNTITVSQDGTYTFSVSDFSFEDADTSDTLQSVSIDNEPAKGTMRLDGASVPTGQAIPVADIENGKLTYSPAAGETGTAYANFTFKVNDGTDDSVAYTMTINVPVLTVIQFNSSTYSFHEPADTSTASIPYTLTGTLLSNATFDYAISSSGNNAATACPTGTSVASCANAGYDFYHQVSGTTVYSGTFTLVPDDPPGYFTIYLLADTAVEDDETFTITLSNPSGVTLGANSVATVAIVDDDVLLPEFTAEFTDANGTAVERLGEGESFGVRVSITNGVTFTTDETVTVTFEDGHHDEDSTVIDADHPNDYSASSLPSATLAAGTTSVQLGTATVVDNGRLETLEAFHAVVTLDGRSTEVSLLIEDTETGPIDLYFDEGNTIELNKPDTFDDRIDLSLRLQNGDTCYVGFRFTTYLEVDDPDGVLSAWYESSGSSAGMSVGEELAVSFAACGRTRTIAFEINQNSGTVGPKVVTFRAGRTTEAFGEPMPRITVANAAQLIVDTPPGPPTDLSARPGFEKVLLRWTAPDSNGGDNVLNYEYEQNGSGTWTSTDGDSTSHTVTGLTNGQAYTFRVRAENYVGSGAASAASASVTPAVDTTPPVLLSAAVNGETVTLDFDEAVFGGDSNNLLLNHFAPRIAGRPGPPRINAIAYVGSTVTLTLGTAVTSEDMFLISYNPDGFDRTQLVALPEMEKLQDANGNLVAAFSRNQAEGTLTNVAMVRAALVALYDATGGDNWTNNTNWKTAAALSTWRGVTTDSEGRVTQLILEFNGLTGTIPDELGELTNLTQLSLNRNNLTGTIPTQLGNLTNLQRLDLSVNGLTGTIPDELGNLTDLTQLSLNRNNLTGSIPAELGNLTNLTELYLNQNNLTGSIPAELGNLTNLRPLSLDQNNLTGSIPAELGNLTNLTELYLNQNNLTGSIPAELGNLTNLTELYLNQNNLTGSIPTELGNLTSLQWLYLDENNLTGSIPTELEKLTNLQWLDLSVNGLTGTIPDALGNLTNLTELYLHDNELSGTIPAALRNLSNLRVLHLNQNNLTGSIPAELGLLTSLRALYLWGNELSGTIPAALGNPTTLRLLSLRDNELTGMIPAALGDLRSLTLLSLSSNKLTGMLPTDLADLTNLQWLYLKSNKDLTGPLPLGLMDLVDLTTVWIQDTGLCAPEDAAFRAWAAAIDDFKGCGGPPPPPGGGGGGSSGPSQTAPDAPTNLIAEAADAAVTLTWDAPEDNGGSAITDYEYRINGRGDWISIGSTNTTHTVTGLDNDTVYTFEVRAVNRNRKGRTSNRVEATPRMPVALDFAHFANGAATTSEIVLVNVSTQPTHPALYFYDTEGNPIAPTSVVDVTGDLMVTEDGSLTVQTAMEPLGELTIRTHGRGEAVTGSVRVVSDGTIGGVLRFDIPGLGVAGVGASAPVQDALFPARRQAGGIRTAAALHNLEAAAMGVSCHLMRGGVALEAVEIPLEANGQTSWFIDDAFTMTDTADFAGAVRCTAPGRGRFTAIAAEIDTAGGIFTTLPVVEVNRGRAEATTLDFAHFANGTWITDLVFVNLETRQSGPPLSPFHTAIPPTRPAIYFYDTEGNPITPTSVVDLTDDLMVTEDGALTVQTEMEPLAVLTISTHGRGEIVSGSVKVVSDGAVGGMVRFDHPALGVAGVEASPPVSNAIFPVRRQEGGITTGVALHNLESGPELVRCELRKEGVLLDAATIPLEANGQTAWFIDTAFPGTDTSDFSGSVRCATTGAGLFTAVALEMDPGTRTFTTLPVSPVIP